MLRSILRSPRRLKRGFTLIELLVVIAIIAILAAILFPVFAQARESARSITCISNQKEISLAWLMYVQDYDETFPWTAQCCTPAGDQIYWLEAVDPYIKSGAQSYSNDQNNFDVGKKASIFVCPDYDLPAPTVDEAGNSAGAGSPYPGVAPYPLISYGVNISITSAWWAFGYSWAGQEGTNGTEAAIAKPAQQIMRMDTHRGLDSWGGQGQSGPGANEWNSARRHKNGMNYSLVDGHAKWFPGPYPQYGVQIMVGTDGNNHTEATGTPVATEYADRPNAPVFWFPREGEGYYH